MSVLLKYTFHMASSQKFISSKSSFFAERKTPSCVSKSKSWTLWPKPLTEIHKRTTTEMSLKTKKEWRRLTRASSEDVASSSSSPLHPLWLSPQWFANILLLLVFVILPYMDSPLSRSPGSSVLIGVGLPITRPSSPLGGPHRLEYCWTPPQSNSPPVFAPPAPRLLLLLLLPPLLLLFQWGEWPMGWDAPEPVPPILVWLVPGEACQLVVPPSDWPCAKKRFTSSSPANSARMVVFPSTHLHGHESDKMHKQWLKLLKGYSEGSINRHTCAETSEL